MADAKVYRVHGTPSQARVVETTDAEQVALVVHVHGHGTSTDHDFDDSTDETISQNV